MWGTADGIKLLDIINPTDYRELNQNAMEDARIPVWMGNAERNVGDNGNIQFIVSQAERNKIAGLNSDGDAGHSFIMKGVDTITGTVNGFTNIGNAMGQVTNTFYGGGFTNPDATGSTYYGSAPPEATTVSAFATGFNAATVLAVLGPGTQNGMCGGTAGTGSDCLKGFTELTNQNVTNLYDNGGVNTTPGSSNSGGSYDSSNPNSMWEYMPNATFATFNAFVGMGTSYVRKDPDATDTNFGTRFKTTFDSGLNLSLNYLYAYDPNPVVQVHWENASGTTLTPEVTTASGGAKTLHLTDGTNYYGAVTDYTGTLLNGSTSQATYNVASAAPVTLVFEETLERVHNIGTAMDFALETEVAPVVLRGEFLYQKDVKTPVINRTELGYGNITEALKMEEADYFKYVLGADITVMTNLMVSAQFIQSRNLDYVSEGGSLSSSTWKYTADQAAMHLSNGLQKAEENKEFYSLFFSKPFGESQLGRWNNITIYEEGGGWWNRFDVEYSFSDQLVGTAELNTYWGDENTTFGQFEESSNIQVGVKYLFD